MTTNNNHASMNTPGEPGRRLRGRRGPGKDPSPVSPPTAPPAIEPPTENLLEVSSTLHTPRTRSRTARPDQSPLASEASASQDPGAGTPDQPDGPEESLFDLVATDGEGTSAALEVVRLNEDAVPLSLFTDGIQRVCVHYCDEPDLRGYIRCNGTGCVLCSTGKKKDPRLLVPVYLPTDKAIGVLLVSPAMRPHSLLPHLLAALQLDTPVVLWVRRDRDRFTVERTEFEDDVDLGEEVIEAFERAKAAGRLRLTSVIRAVSNDDLAAVPQIEARLKLRGVRR